MEEDAFSCSNNPHKNNITKHLELPSRSLDTFSMWYGNIILLGDFNVCVDDETLKTFYNSSYYLKILIKPPTFSKNPEKPSCVEIVLPNRPQSF